MKGKIIIEANESSLHIDGHMGFNGQEEIYELVASFIESSGLDSPDELAKLIVYCCGRRKNPGNRSERYEFRIPR